MTGIDDDDETPADGEDAAGRAAWVESTEEALARVREALRAAWDASEEGRVKALEAARSAASQLGEAIDRGTTAARSRFAAGSEDATDEADATPDGAPGPDVQAPGSNGDAAPADPADDA